jgi:hypothetical protein
VSQTSHDAKAVVRALDALTTQVRRIADAQQRPADAPTTTADDGPASDRCVHPGPHPGFTCAEVDASQPYFRVRWEQEQQAPAADADAQRTTRRKSLRVLLNRLNNGLPFTSSEAELLTRHVATEICDANAGHTAAAELEQAHADRDGAYRERAQLLALLASLYPSVIAPAPDVGEPGWQILYLRIGGKQASWHIAPRDADLVAHVEHVPVDDSRAQWDGHTTGEKYAHIGEHAARLYAEARGRVEASAPATLDGTEQPAGCRCHNGDELCSGCRRCPDICNGCDGPEFAPAHS